MEASSGEWSNDGEPYVDATFGIQQSYLVALSGT
jgi:hypothetical protein